MHVAGVRADSDRSRKAGAGEVSENKKAGAGRRLEWMSEMRAQLSVTNRRSASTAVPSVICSLSAIECAGDQVPSFRST
jgi:hypothetical protein